MPDLVIYRIFLKKHANREHIVDYMIRDSIYL